MFTPEAKEEYKQAYVKQLALLLNPNISSGCVNTYLGLLASLDVHNALQPDALYGPGHVESVLAQEGFQLALTPEEEVLLNAAGGFSTSLLENQLYDFCMKNGMKNSRLVKLIERKRNNG